MRVLLPTFWTDDCNFDAEFVVWNANQEVSDLVRGISEEVKNLKKKYPAVESISLKNINLDLTFVDREQNETSQLYVLQEKALKDSVVEIPEDLVIKETDHKVGCLEAVVSDEWIYLRACDHGTNNYVETELVRLEVRA